MRNLLIALPILLGTVTAAQAQVSLGVSMPGISIGINVPTYPQLLQIPGYPVYYDPRSTSNYFFYDGLYWVYRSDDWYQSSWYDGPWQSVEPEFVPLYVLRVPVHYYRQPPIYFSGWRADAPPRWGDHWGREWERNRSGWDHWDRRGTPQAAPLPMYQRRYSGDRYPQAEEQQRSIRTGNYRYQPRDAISQQYIERQQVQPPERQQFQQQRIPEQVTPDGGRFEPRGRAPMQQRPDAPQGRGQDNRAEPQDRPHGNNAGPQNQGRDRNNNDEEFIRNRRN